MLKKVLSLLLVLLLVFSCVDASFAAKKKKAVSKKKVVRVVKKKKAAAKKVKKAPAAAKAAKKKKKKKKKAVSAFAGAEEPAAAEEPQEIKLDEGSPQIPISQSTTIGKLLGKQRTAIKTISANRTGIFGEGGFGGGALVLELGYGAGFGENINLGAALGYGFGNQYSVMVLDPVKASYFINDNYYVGAGLNYAMYSALVADIPGISGAISGKNMFGVELFGGGQYDNLGWRIGYSTALGLRLSVVQYP